MKYLTIDFETASRYEYSPCAVSIYEFDTDTREEKQLLSTLINPGNVLFEPRLTQLHGITQEMVENAPSIKTVLEKICILIKNQFVFAHNAPFDISKIIQGCDYYEIPIPDFEYADSLMLSKRTWTGLINYKLDTVCEFLEIPLNHHNCDSDAISCGQIILKAIETHNSFSIDDVLDKIKYCKGYYKNNEWIHAYSKKLNSNTKNTTKKSYYDKIKEIEINYNATSALNGKYIVFTGTLSITREDAMKKAADCGAIPNASVNKKTNYLVVGRDDYGKFKLGTKSNKMIRAEELINQGQDLEIITEDDFIELLVS